MAPHISVSMQLDELCTKYSNFRPMDRKSFDGIASLSDEKLDMPLRKHVIDGGKPLVIDGIHQVSKDKTLSAEWLLQHQSNAVAQIRDLDRGTTLELEMATYLKQLPRLAQPFLERHSRLKKNRLQLEATACSDTWVEHLNSHLSAPLRSHDLKDQDSYNPDRMLYSSLAAFLPKDKQPAIQHFSIGHEGTFTNAGQSLCASVLYNIMVDASTDEGSHRGSCLWFVILPSDRRLFDTHWNTTLSINIDTDPCFLPIDHLARAPFHTYVFEQKPGDLVILPPLATYQTYTRGTMAMSVQWSKHTSDTVALALKEILPQQRMMCYRQHSRIKLMAYHSLLELYKAIVRARTAKLDDHNLRSLERQFVTLLNPFRDTMLSEAFNEADQPDIQLLATPNQQITCSYCDGDIFNRFLTCEMCTSGAIEHGLTRGPYDICMECYIMGRSCFHLSGLVWREQLKWKTLVDQYNAFSSLLSSFNHTEDKIVPFVRLRSQQLSKTAAEICTSQLSLRPIYQGTEFQAPQTSTPRGIADTYSHCVQACHICHYGFPSWQLAHCTRCDEKFCYQDLYDLYDQAPIDTLQDKSWQCPHCWGMCCAAQCTRWHGMMPSDAHLPRLLDNPSTGADHRSVQVFVDYDLSSSTAGLYNDSYCVRSHGQPDTTVREGSTIAVRQHSSANRAKSQGRKRRAVGSPDDSGEYAPSTSDSGDTMDTAEDLGTIVATWTSNEAWANMAKPSCIHPRSDAVNDASIQQHQQLSRPRSASIDNVLQPLLQRRATLHAETSWPGVSNTGSAEGSIDNPIMLINELMSPKSIVDRSTSPYSPTPAQPIAQQALRTGQHRRSSSNDRIGGSKAQPSVIELQRQAAVRQAARRAEDESHAQRIVKPERSLARSTPTLDDIHQASQEFDQLAIFEVSASVNVRRTKASKHAIIAQEHSRAQRQPLHSRAPVLIEVSHNMQRGSPGTIQHKRRRLV